MSQYSAENSEDSAKSNTRLIPLVEIGLPRQGSIYTNAGGVAIPPPQLKQLSLKCWKAEKPHGVREFLPNFNSWKVKPPKQVYSCHINQKYILFINKD